MTGQSETPLLQLRGIQKKFGTTVTALSSVDMDVEHGRVHGLLGANGAGKSTLIKILSGTHQATQGTIKWKDTPVSFPTPKAANDIGVATIHQHIPLVPSLSVIENVFLAQSGIKRQTQAMRQQFSALCHQMQFWIDPDCIVSTLRIGQRQMVSIMQALSTGAELIIMDEPTASLAAEEREVVYQIIRHLSQNQGKAILFVSHFLDEVMALTDHVTVLRDGMASLDAKTRELTEDKLAEAIVGGQIIKLGTARNHDDLPNDNRLTIRNLQSDGKFNKVNLDIKRGEVIGLAGLLGSGRSEILHAIYGADRYATGSVELDGKSLGRSPSTSVKYGMALVPEDRAAQGLFSNFELWRNITLPNLCTLSKFGFFPSKSQETATGRQAISDLNIKAHSEHAFMSELSGGNAQKVTIARWLFDEIKVLLLDEPTAGIDIGAKTDILKLVRQLAEQGKTIVLVSSEFEELLSVCDRILVVRDGKIVAERKAGDTNEHELFLLSGGKTNNRNPRQQGHKQCLNISIPNTQNHP